jgi:hypothetical protein
MGDGLTRARSAIRTHNDAIRAAKRAARQLAADEAFSTFAALLTRDGLPLPEREYRFCPPRKWRMDYAYPAQRVGIEVDGGIWLPGGGHHTRGQGWLDDAEKLNTAASMGWRMLRTTPTGLCDLAFIALLRRTLTPLTPR